MSAKPHIAVLMGGWSPEREISLISGAKCAEALRALDYQVSEIDVTRQLDAQLGEVKPDICFNALHGIGGNLWQATVKEMRCIIHDCSHLLHLAQHQVSL